MAQQKEQLKQLECKPECGFMVRSHDEKELVGIVKEHAKSMHKMTMKDKEIKEMIKTA